MARPSNQPTARVLGESVCELRAVLDPYRGTMKQAAAAHSTSAKQCLVMVTDALTGGVKRRVTKFSRGSWVPVWPAGAAMFAYMFSHEAHHRGQILMLAHQLGIAFHPTCGDGSGSGTGCAGLQTRPR